VDGLSDRFAVERKCSGSTMCGTRNVDAFAGGRESSRTRRGEELSKNKRVDCCYTHGERYGAANKVAYTDRTGGLRGICRN
jgi:hypothetical protein